MSEPKYKKYGFEYYHDGSWWTFHLYATSFADADIRLKKLPLAKCIGTLEESVPAWIPFAGVYVHLRHWWRNRQ